MPPTASVTRSSQLEADAILARANALLSKENFSKEDGARADGLLRLHDQLLARQGLDRARRAKLTLDEASVGMRTERTRRLDTVAQDFWLAVRHGASMIPTDDPARRALAVGVNSAGGYLVPSSLSDRIYSAMAGVDKLFDPDVVTVITTSDGGDFSLPLDNDIAGAGGAIVAENGPFAEAQDVAFEVLALGKAPTWRADMVRLSMELAQDSGYDLESYLAAKFSKRLVKCIGASLFATLVSQATKGVDAGASAITADNLFDLLDSVDESYTSSPRCGWLMKRSTLTAVRKLKDTANQPIFRLERDDAGRFVLEGFPVFLCPSADAIGTTKKSVLFGDLGQFIVRLVADSMKLRVLRERHITLAQVAFLMWARVHGGLAKFSTADSPVKYLLHA